MPKLKALSLLWSKQPCHTLYPLAVHLPHSAELSSYYQLSNQPHLTRGMINRNHIPSPECSPAFNEEICDTCMSCSHNIMLLECLTWTQLRKVLPIIFWLQLWWANVAGEKVTNEGHHSNIILPSTSTVQLVKVFSNGWDGSQWMWNTNATDGHCHCTVWEASDKTFTIIITSIPMLGPSLHPLDTSVWLCLALPCLPCTTTIDDDIHTATASIKKMMIFITTK